MIRRSVENFDIVNMTKGKLPSLPFLDMKNAVLGKNYDLSVAIVSRTTMKELNSVYRNKNVPTDILSFPLSKKSGEIFLNFEEAKKEAPKFSRPFENFLAFLFIHGLVHLKGMTHGSRMENIERKFRVKFNI